MGEGPYQSQITLEGEPQREGPLRTPSCSTEELSHSGPVQSLTVLLRFAVP